MKENLLPYYPSYYINEDGTEVYRKNSFISSKGKIYQKNKRSDWYKLRIKVCSDGRPKVNLWKDNHRVKVRIQRLVALAWIPNPENKPYVCHKDNNPLIIIIKIYTGELQKKMLNNVLEMVDSILILVGMLFLIERSIEYIDLCYVIPIILLMRLLKNLVLGDVWYLKLRRNMDRKSHILPVLLSLSFLVTSQFYVFEPSIMLPS